MGAGRVWLIVRPPVDPDGKRGVYPKTDRNSLLIRGGPNAGGSLPLGEWASEFSENMPQEIIDALSAARKDSGSSLDDDKWRETLAEKFASRWRLAWLRVKAGGHHKAEPDADGAPPIRRSKRLVRELVEPKPIWLGKLWRATHC